MDRILNIDELIKELEKYSFKQLHLHHTWKPTHKNFNGSNHLQLQQSMRNYHVQSLGWADIGQHLSLMPDGKFVTGRSFAKAPASIKGWNSGALALEMVGNFDTPGTGQYNNLGYDELKGNQRRSVLKLIKWFGDKYGYSSIKFHREGPGVGKTCPGTSLNKQALIDEAKGYSTKPAELYRVRKAWDDPKSQIGAYKVLSNAKAMADKNKGYNVYDSTGRLVYPIPTQKPVEVAPKPRVTWEYYIVGQEVKNLQRELNKQFNAGLKVDGWFGDNTINALVNVRRGARGNLTRIIQRRLIAKGYKLRYGADGIYGNATYNAVVRFQRDHGLVADGIVGKNTWKALFRK